MDWIEIDYFGQKVQIVGIALDYRYIIRPGFEKTVYNKLGYYKIGRLGIKIDVGVCFNLLSRFYTMTEFVLKRGGMRECEGMIF